MSLRIPGYDALQTAYTNGDVDAMRAALVGLGGPELAITLLPRQRFRVDGAIEPCPECGSIEMLRPLPGCHHKGCPTDCKNYRHDFKVGTTVRVTRAGPFGQRQGELGTIVVVRDGVARWRLLVRVDPQARYPEGHVWLTETEMVRVPAPMPAGNGEKPVRRIGGAAARRMLAAEVQRLDGAGKTTVEVAAALGLSLAQVGRLIRAQAKGDEKAA